MEERGMTLLCQGLDGGVNRTKAGFLAADGPVIWVITPWAYEGVHLPAGTVTTLCLTGMPFDHPSHAVLSQRAAHYQDPFTDYSLPRMEHRLFRLLRNFSSQCSKDATVLILDKRIATKKYGRKVAEYIKSFSQDFTEEGQMSLL
jgi:Rad3-related DNA helicase